MNFQPSAAANRDRFWRRLLEVGLWIAARDDLPKAEEERRPHRTGPSPLRWLISRSPLPTRVDSSREARIPSRWLASKEELPHRVDVSTRTRGFLTWLAGREELPAAPTSKPVSAQSFVRWLLTPESPDSARKPVLTKEVPPHES